MPDLTETARTGATVATASVASVDGATLVKHADRLDASQGA
jgi:hypothetical protein